MLDTSSFPGIYPSNFAIFSKLVYILKRKRKKVKNGFSILRKLASTSVSLSKRADNMYNSRCLLVLIDHDSFLNYTFLSVET